MLSVMPCGRKPTRLETAQVTRRRFAFKSLLWAAIAGLAAAADPLVAEPDGRMQLVPFETSPFPYDGGIPGQNKPFLDVVSGNRRGHTSPRGGVYWEDQTYSDRRVLLYVPPRFDPQRPAVMVIYLHGNNAILMRDVVKRQQIPQQLASSGLNAVLVAPQFAVDALDSSAGRFWEPDVFPQFLTEAAERLTALYGDARVHRVFLNCPIVLAAYSGGYMPASSILLSRGVNDRLKGVLLFDALYGEADTFADWIMQRRSQAFFFSAYSASTHAQNVDLDNRLIANGIETHQQMPRHLHTGEIVFLPSGESLVHNDFMSQAWTAYPLAAALARLRGAF
jgi:hypothetical protein